MAGLLLLVLFSVCAEAVEIPFSCSTTVAPSLDGADAVALGDIDGDGDLAVASAATADSAIGWWESTNGDGSAWTDVVIEPTGLYELLPAFLAALLATMAVSLLCQGRPEKNA